MKRFFSFMMSLVLVLSLGVTAFAAENTGSITITNATVGETYSVYKIFDAALNTDKSGISYSITTANQFFETMFGKDGKTPNSYFIYDAESGAVTRNTEEDKNDAELFKYLERLINDDMKPAKDPIKAESTTVVFTELDYGYYLITSTQGATVTIDSTKPNAVVIDKNQTTTNLDKKIKAEDDANWADATSANVGDTVNFKVEFTALNYKGEEKVTKYTIEDTLYPDNWAEINIDSIQIKVGDKVLTKDTDWNLVSDPANTNGFEIEIPWMEGGNFLYDPSVPVEVTYFATVLDAAASNNPVDNKNTAKLTWNNTTETDETITKVYNMGFTKVDGTDANKTLAGAKFELYSDEKCEIPVNVTGTGGVYMVDPDGTSNEVVTPADGQVVIMGLKEGTYYLKETKAPDGYNLMDKVTEVNVGGTGTDTVKTTYIVNNGNLDIQNNKGVELPSTGGEGTMKMITIGTIVAMAFAVLLITHKKMTIYQD